MIDPMCFTCGLEHQRDPIRGCPHQFDSPETLARLHANREARQLAEASSRKAAEHRLVMASIQGTLEQQAQADAEDQRQRQQAKVSARLQEALDTLRQQRQVEAERIEQDAAALLEPIRYADNHVVQERVRRWRESRGR